LLPKTGEGPPSKFVAPPNGGAKVGG